MLADSNAIIRYLIKDDELRAYKVDIFIDTYQIIITDVTLAEVYWTLEKFYKVQKELLINHLEGLVGSKNVLCNKPLIKETFNILKRLNIDFIDAYTAAYALLHNDGEVLSFDRDFDKIPDIKRIEP